MRAVLLFVTALVCVGVSELQSQSTFRAAVDLVRLDVRVTHPDGRPVNDLRQDEIRVLEGGRERPILFFQRVDEPAGDYTDIARRTIASEVSTNRGAPRGHLYVLVFDQQHITAGNEQRARRAAERFLRTRVRRGDRVALFALPGPGPRLSLTSEVQRAISQLGAIRGMLDRTTSGRLGTMRVHEAYEIARGNERVLTRVATRLATEAAGTDTTRANASARSTSLSSEAIMPPRVVQEDARVIVATTDETARQFLLGLEALVNDLRPIEGRKAIVLVSEGFHADNVSRELERVAAAAARAYGVVYALDVGARTEGAAANVPTAEDAGAELQSRLEPLGSLAAETDGRLFADVNSWSDDVMTQIAGESQSYYLVGFASSDEARRDPTRYRRVDVKVTRPDIRVSTRSGYALESAPRSAADRRRAIDLALAAPYPLQEVPIEFTTYTLRSEGTARQRVVMTLEAELPPAAAGRTAAAADVVFAVRRAIDGVLAASGSDRLSSSQGDDLRTLRSTYRVQFELDPGEYLMRVVVREPGGLIGSADRRFSVRSLASRDISASDLVFSTPDRELAVRAYAFAGDVLSGALELYGTNRGDLERAEVFVDLARYGGSGTVTSVAAEAMPLRDESAGMVRPMHVAIPLGSVEPGEYIARARIRVSGQAVGEVTRDVEVRARDAANSERNESQQWSFRPELILQGELAKQAASEAKQSPDAFRPFERGRVAFAAGDFAAAVGAWAEAADFLRAPGRVVFLLGWAHAGVGDQRAAIGAWRRAVHLEPALIPAHLAIIDMFLSLGERALAEQSARAALAVVPDSKEIRERLTRIERR